MSTTTSRAVWRQSRCLIRRPAFRSASTTAEAASRSKVAATSAASKASEGISKAASTAGPAVIKALTGVGGALKRVGGRTGKCVAFVDLFRGQKMYPPGLTTFTEFYQPLLKYFRQPRALMSQISKSFNTETLLRLQSLDKKQLAVLGVTTAELIGFFSVGEIIGRFKLVGYRGETAHAH
ncbi:ATP synthase subunit g [Histoplasma capsulatum G186AR]|uniref:ATP synthase subunit g n=1 Tax=Ajellomyces capsulatus (strain G186AR / H82 / ATCC MYA-2454 / RMSCC 2432) TaxID=447093 RepID=C0NEE3_AJECG|nr:ATP synthase subunit g [Histoplasma capsulatum G186AR]EEH09614.1 ATP synthase subunit g [Histoplasma capsulatum G186AR]